MHEVVGAKCLPKMRTRNPKHHLAIFLVLLVRNGRCLAPRLESVGVRVFTKPKHLVAVVRRMRRMVDPPHAYPFGRLSWATTRSAEVCHRVMYSNGQR